MSILLAVGDADDAAVWRSVLRAALPEETLLTERGADDDAIDIALVADPPPGALAGLERLRLVQSLWAGVDRLLADPTLPADVPIARMVDPSMSAAMAETALWACLSLHRGFFEYARQQRDGEWRVRAQRRADEVHICVLGLGELGGAVARRLVAAGYRVAAASARPKAIDGVEVHAGGIEAIDAVIASSEIVLSLLPLTAATRGLFDAARFARMRRGGAFVNLARGAQVVEADLLDALDSGRLRHAVLDVFAVEPLPREHRFWRHPRVTVLPHVAALTDPRSAAEVAARNVRALREGRAVEHLVDRARGY